MNTATGHLYVKQSGIPYSGMGLYTSEEIKKGETIIEYTGEIKTWDEVKDDPSNGYIYFVKEDHVIDANNSPDAIGRYVNDARGLTRVKGLTNNSRFVTRDGRVFIKAIKDIPPDTEILVSYGSDYWNTIKKNKALADTRKFQKK